MQTEVRYSIWRERMRPLGPYEFAAKPVYHTKVSDLHLAEDPPATEFWGRTEAEAVAKVRSAVQAWATKVGVNLVEM